MIWVQSGKAPYGPETSPTWADDFMETDVDRAALKRCTKLMFKAYNIPLVQAAPLQGIPSPAPSEQDHFAAASPHSTAAIASPPCSARDSSQPSPPAQTVATSLASAAGESAAHCYPLLTPPVKLDPAASTSAALPSPLPSADADVPISQHPTLVTVQHPHNGCGPDVEGIQTAILQSGSPCGHTTKPAAADSAVRRKRCRSKIDNEASKGLRPVTAPQDTADGASARDQSRSPGDRQTKRLKVASPKRL